MLSHKQKEELQSIISTTEHRIKELKKERARARFLKRTALMSHLEHDIDDLNDILRSYQKRLIEK